MLANDIINVLMSMILEMDTFQAIKRIGLLMVHQINACFFALHNLLYESDFEYLFPLGRHYLQLSMNTHFLELLAQLGVSFLSFLEIEKQLFSIK